MDGCCKYTTRKDAETALENSLYSTWCVGEDAHPMTEDEMDEVVSYMWHGQLCPRHGMTAWLNYTYPENIDQYGLSDGYFCTGDDDDDCE